MKNIVSIPALTNTFKKVIVLTLFITAAGMLHAQTNLVQNPGFTNGAQSWSTNCSIEINPETVYGGSNASNKVSEIDKERCLHQDIIVMPGTQYIFSFKAVRRQSGTPATVGITVRITGRQSGTHYISEHKTYTQTSWNYTTETFSITIPANATDNRVRISFSNYVTSGTYGTLIDDIFFAVDPQAAALPIKLVGFKGTLQNGYAQLSWIASNRDNDGDHFVIERSAAGQNKFDSIDRVELTAGNGHYTYTDNSLLKSSYQYRLKAVHQDGSVFYSKIVLLGNGVNTNFNVYPNPAISRVQYTLNVAAATNVTVQVYSLSGTIVMNTRSYLQSGDNTVSLDISSLPAGSFFLTVLDGEGNKYVKTIRKS